MPTIVLVEGESDKAALETLAARYGRDLEAAGVETVAIGGAHAIRRVLAQSQPAGSSVKFAGLVDAGELDRFRLALEGAGLGADLDRDGMEVLGFFVCERDLEDELIRAVGVEGVVKVIAEQGELPSWIRFQRQPAQRGRAHEAQLRRFLGTHSGRKAQYARALVEACDLGQAPRPLERLLAVVLSA